MKQKDVIPNNYTMLMRFVYDTTSFSDVLAQLTVVTTTTSPTPVENNEPAPHEASIDAAKEEDGKPVSK
ncbi:hypothetical protein Neosp_008186 [[Neocosmospora] mangrovei]